MSFSRINTNIQAMQAFASLQKNSATLAMRRQRLATGKRINAAEDDSAGYSIAKKLEAKTRGQGQALKNINDAKSMLTVAEGGLNSTMDILQTMKEKAVQAANDTMGDSEREAIKGQLNALNDEIFDIVGGTDAAGNATGGTDFNGRSLLNGDAGALSFQVGAESDDTFGVRIAGFGLSKETGNEANALFADASLAGDGFAAASGFDVGDSAKAGDAIDRIDYAISSVSKQISSLGDSQKRLSFKQDNLSTAQTNYESARSGIEDADFAKEQMEISKQQILQQAGIATFAQANASSQAVLSFLG